MTREEFATRVWQVITESQCGGLTHDDMITELDSIIEALTEEND